MMTGLQNTAAKFERLRKQAEGLIRLQPEIDSQSFSDILELIQELNIYQTELETQNQQLRKAQEELTSLHKEYEKLYEFAPCGYVTLNSRGIVSRANLMAVNLLQTEKDALLEASLTRFIASDFEAVFLKSRQEAKESGERRSVELLLDNRKEQPQWVRMEIEADRAENGEEVQWLVMLIDIQERKQAEEKLLRQAKERENLEKQFRQAQKMEAVGTLAGGIAHDFNNILASVIGYAELALDDAPEGSMLRDNLFEVLAAGNRAKELVRQILTVSRLENHSRQAVQINPLLKEVLKMLRSTMPASIEIRENITSEPLIVQADPTQIHQVLVNLATNAMQSMSDREGVLEVRLDSVSFDENIQDTVPDLSPGEYVRLAVNDTGSGIPGDRIEKIFEPYFTTKAKETGTGLGLSVVQGIVRSHHGHITVSSEPGTGSTFTVYLPLVQKASRERPDHAFEQLPTGNEHILLIDDEPGIVSMQKQSLERLGYTVTGKTGSLEALEDFRSSPQKFDLVFTDMTMPKLTGEKLSAAVKDIRPDVPVILCTGYSEKLTRLRENPKIEAVLMKPLDFAATAKTIRAVLDDSKVSPASGEADK
ncbi:MAG: response regulator [Desulfohalobiaceae bacterium]|nr:response regulator [Desulfohalobiaceae bacterium]